MAIRFPTGPVKLAYDIVGGGEPPLGVIPGWVSNLQLDRDTPLGRGLYVRVDCRVGVAVGVGRPAQHFPTRQSASGPPQQWGRPPC
jgi:hypothetical protein